MKTQLKDLSHHFIIGFISILTATTLIYGSILMNWNQIENGWKLILLDHQ